VAGVVISVHIFRFIPIRAPGLIENRKLVSFPPWPTTMTEALEFPQKIDGYIQDNFPPRAHFISLINTARYKLGYSGSSRIVVGKDGWLFFDDGSHLAIWRGVERMDKTQLSSWVNGLLQRLKRAHAPFYVMFGPNKQSIFPEKVPSSFARVSQTTLTDDLMRAVRARGIDCVIDPRQLLIDAKAHTVVYTRYDTHWTGEGAYLAYAALMQRMSRDLSDMQPLGRNAFRQVEGKDSDLAETWS
jgi:hypothetical protein